MFWAYLQLGRALYLQTRYQEAIGAFEHALQLNPAFQYAYRGLGRVYLDQGDYSRARGPYPFATTRVKTRRAGLSLIELRQTRQQRA